MLVAPFCPVYVQKCGTVGTYTRHLHGLQGTDLVPSNARSHTCLLAGRFLGDIQVLVRLSVGIDPQKQVAMKLAVRSEDPAVSDIIHEIINS